MNRSTSRILALLTGLALGQSALAQTVAVDQPEIAGRELVSSTSNPIFSITGFAAAANITGTCRVYTVTRDGTVANIGGADLSLTASIDHNNDGTASAATTAGGNATFAVILGSVGGLGGDLALAAAAVGSGTGNSQIVAYGIRFNFDNGSAGTTGPAVGGAGTLTPTIPAGLTIGNANVEQITFPAGETVQATTNAAQVTDARVQTSGTNTVLTLLFNRALISQALAPAAAVNFRQLTVAAVGPPPTNTTVQPNTDLQFASSSAFTTTMNVASAGATTVEIVGPSNNALRLTIPTANVTSGFGAGQFIRGTPGQLDLRDYLGRELAVDDTDGVQVGSVNAFALLGAEFVKRCPTNATTPAALRVRFNNPVNVAGLAGSYLLTLNGAAAAGFVLSNPTIDPSNPQAVLLDVQTPALGGDGVASDGLSINATSMTTGQFAIQVTDAAATDPADLFGQTFTGQSAVTSIGDAIAPALATTGNFSAGNSVAFVDTNRNGEQDGVLVAFDEPVSNVTASTGFQLTRVGGIATNPFFLITSAATAIPNALNTVANSTIANNVITIASGAFSSPSTGSGVSRTNVDLDNNGTLSFREMNNGVLITFDPRAVDWDNDGTTRSSATPDPNEAVPGTANANAVLLFLNPTTASATNAASGQTVAPVVITDAATTPNTFSNGGVTVSEDSSVDRSAPVVAVAAFLTGDNQDAGSNDQLFNEQDGGLGDATANNRLTFFAGENFSGATAANLTEGLFRFGSGGPFSFVAANGSGSDNTVFGFAAANSLTLLNVNNNPNYVAGVPVSILAGSGLGDAALNRTTLNETTSVNLVAPYLALVAGVDGGNTSGAFLLPSSTDANFAGSISMAMTQPINSATVAASDFTLSIGAITTVAVNGTEIVLNLNTTDTALRVPITGSVQIDYNGAADTNRIASTTTGGGTGIAVSAVAASDPDNNRFTASRILAPTRPTQSPAIMDIVGEIEDENGNPVPAGTKVYAMIAIPRINSITATHNGVTFTAMDNASRQAFTNHFYGLREFLYLVRNNTNLQTYSDAKTTGANDVTYNDVVDLTVNYANLNAITFSGTGETAGDTVTGGTARLCWDVMRSSDGTLQSLYTLGYSVGGTPIVSSTVITGTDGAYSLHVSGPISAFDGLSRLSVNRNPIIIIVELANGRRFVASSLLTSVAGGPVLFDPQNRRQTGTSAPDARVFNIALANIKTVPAYPGWNLVPFGCDGGFANSTANIPARPAGLSATSTTNPTGTVVIPTTSTPLPIGASPLEQFVYFVDTTIDGQWTRTENSNFSSIIIDSDCIPNFAFTMTSFGVQVGSGINNLIGGYALGFFVNNTTSYGIFQFGEPLDNPSFFGSTATTRFPNSATTLGWALVTAPDQYPDIEDVETENDFLDFVFLFRNNGPNAATVNRPIFEVSSFGFGAGNDGGPQDATTVDDGQALFAHFN